MNAVMQAGRTDASSPYMMCFTLTTKEEADHFLHLMVSRAMKEKPSLSVEKATKIQKHNIGYFAGNFDVKSRQRVFELFDTEHPITGRCLDVSPQTLFDMRATIGRLTQEGKSVAEAIASARLEFGIDSAHERMATVMTKKKRKK